jgi:hypothetical protein
MLLLPEGVVVDTLEQCLLRQETPHRGELSGKREA